MVGWTRSGSKRSQRVRAHTVSISVRHRGRLAGLGGLLALTTAASAQIQTLSVGVALWVGPVGCASMRVDALIIALAAAVDVIVSPQAGATTNQRRACLGSSRIGVRGLRSLHPREACGIGAESVRLGLAGASPQGRKGTRIVRRVVGPAASSALHAVGRARVLAGEKGRALHPLHGRVSLVELGLGTEDDAAVGVVVAMLEGDGAATVWSKVEFDDATTWRGLEIDHAGDGRLQRGMEADVAWELWSGGGNGQRERVAAGHCRLMERGGVNIEGG